jgi:hypothetical protein
MTCFIEQVYHTSEELSMTEICENTTPPKPQISNASFLPRFKDGGLLRRLAEDVPSGFKGWIEEFLEANP